MKSVSTFIFFTLLVFLFALPLHASETETTASGSDYVIGDGDVLYVSVWKDQTLTRELTVLPGATVTIKDNGAYGMIMMQGHGTMGVWDIETPTMIRYGQLTHDEYFVSEAAAQAGVKITNPSKSDPIVMLKHFGPNNPDLILEWS